MVETFKEYPDPPLGLEYEFCENPALCLGCGGVVATGERMMRRSSYRNRAFEQEFLGNNPFCLTCSKEKLAIIVARFFGGAQNAIQQYNNIEDATDKGTILMREALEASVEQIQDFISLLSTFVEKTDKEQVVYEQEPEPAIVDLGDPGSSDVREDSEE